MQRHDREVEMSSISFLKGQKEVFQIEFSRFFGLKYAVQFIRNFRRLLLRSSFLRIIVLFVLAVCIVAYTLFSGQDKFAGTSWLVPDTCVADSCRVQKPLLMSELSSNLLLVLIHSSAGGKGVRDVIRQTWASGLSNHFNAPIQYRFILGGEDVYPSVTEKLQAESDQFRDIVILPDVTDSLITLTRRTIRSFNYAYYSMDSFSYILKCDDDSLIDVMRIASELQNRQRKDRLYWGYMAGATHLYWYGVYAEFNWFTCNTYTPYALGGGYVLSRDLVELLVLNEPHLKMYRCEDTALGSWLAPYNIEYKHDSRFNTNTPSRGCKDPFLILHKVTTSDMLYYYKTAFQEDKKLCSWRTNWHNFNGYLYKWDNLPSTCCLKNPAVP